MKINTNGKIWVERTWRNERELVQPDKTMVDERKHSTIVEVTCRYESSKVYLLQREEEKVAKYWKLIEHELDQFECKTGEVTSIVIGSIDTILDKINQELGLD